MSYDEISKHSHNTKMKFKTLYQGAFKEVIECHFSHWPFEGAGCENPSDKLGVFPAFPLFMGVRTFIHW